MSGLFDHLRTCFKFKNISLPENPAAAQKVTNEILRVAQNLRDFPMLGHTGRRAGTREIITPHYPYFISYRLTTKKVIVLAVIHQSHKYP